MCIPQQFDLVGNSMMLLRNCIIRSTTSSVASLIVSWPGVLGKLSASRHL
ncbi:TPA: hypothetical protein QCQ96_000394 [Bacillus cereus]|nr:hypothetical protein [Bacillus cereus]